MQCLSCDYNLVGLTEHRCPECGRAFDPRNQKTYFLPELGRESRNARYTYIACMGAPLLFPLALLAMSIIVGIASGSFPPPPRPGLGVPEYVSFSRDALLGLVYVANIVAPVLCLMMAGTLAILQRARIVDRIVLLAIDPFNAMAWFID